MVSSSRVRQTRNCLRSAWRRVVAPFLKDMRKQFLVWRTLDDETMDRYRAKGGDEAAVARNAERARKAAEDKAAEAAAAKVAAAQAAEEAAAEAEAEAEAGKVAAAATDGENQENQVAPAKDEEGQA